MHLASLTLDNGTVITLAVRELEDDYAIEATSHLPPRRS
jgi:hypothetical protein